MYNFISPLGETIIKGEGIPFEYLKNIAPDIEPLIESLFEKGYKIKEITIEKIICPLCKRPF